VIPREGNQIRDKCSAPLFLTRRQPSQICDGRGS
jgi:hypothetical protein